MTGDINSPRLPRVALLVESSFGYGRELLLGIARYTRIHRNWSSEFEEGDPSERLPSWFSLGDWDGIIARLKSQAILEAVIQSGAPVVDLSGVYSDYKYPVIRSDEAAVGQLAAQHLLERGFRHLAFCGFEGVDWSDMRNQGFEKHLATAGLSYHCFQSSSLTALPMHAEYEEHSTQHIEELKGWLIGLPRPLGIMAANDSRGRQIIDCCQEMGIPVPDEIAVIGVDKDEILSELSGIPLSSVVLNAQNIGYQAASMLDCLMTGQDEPKQLTLIEPKGIAMHLSTDVLAIDDKHLSNALRHIREHACSGLDVEGLLRTVPLSRSVLERRFSKALGTSPKALILQTKLKRVKELLEESDLSLPEIAARSGFEYPEYMSRLFKKKMLMTPGEFRKQSAPRTAGQK